MYSIKQKPQNNFLVRFLVKISPIAKYQIGGESMLPALRSGDTVLVNRLAYVFTTPLPLDIVACLDPRDGKVLIKRISKKSDEKYFVTGDNKLHSTDSREFGMIGKPAILGKVIGKL